MRAPRIVLAWLRGSLSPEQRWTSGLALFLTVALLLFGHPSLPGVVRRHAPPLIAAAPVAPPVSVSAVPSPAPPPPPPPGLDSASEPLPPAGGDDEPAPLSPAISSTRVLALAVQGGLPGRDDEAAARTFLASSTLAADVLVANPSDPGLCERVAAAADVVVASLGLDDELRRCLVDRGKVVLAFDGHGSLADPAGGAVVSTRRGITDSLSDAINWGLASGSLQGRVGVVAAASVRREIEEVEPSWRAAGLRIVATTFVPNDDPAPPPGEVQRFVAADVDVVLFAVPATIVGRWALQHSLLDRPVRYVVGDVFDTVWSEAYPPVLDGALAHTSLQVPWFAREHGETQVQAACRRPWEERALAPTLIPGAETVVVYAWCQHVELLEAVAATDDPAAALRASVRASPLTSDLGPLGPGQWGPREDAVVSWRSSCACWRSVRDFTDRPG